MTNQDEIFCLIGSFLNRLKPSDWSILSITNHLQNNKRVDKLIITDKVKGRIAKKLSKIYKVKEV